ncbi:uncharacterized protein LOC116309092 [Actinia tenebrosa]|uniref:Uncharacterized protein LOC116309092 n=1 Tax=Actinia tenebrosa TaxID=6105 RepID=A0A6P8J6T4_ACTTE|nr:uncharacterized protein LOC116309092 [Actinia tenebrosa]XP_031575502.1 uncharacterized protein LOC116309092 [Actinia tenebrosa]
MFHNKKRSLYAHSLRGVGTGSRLIITNEYLTKQGLKIEKMTKVLKWINQEGRAFYSSKAVEEFIRSEQEGEILSDESDADYLPSASSDDCLSSPEKSFKQKRLKVNQDDSKISIELPVKYHIAMTSQLEDFIEQINKTHSCTVPTGCKGKLVPVKIQEKGLGGAVKVNFACSGCGNEIHYASSQVALLHHKRNCVSLETALCFLVYGQGYHNYYKVLKLGVGLDVLARINFQKIIKLAYPHIKTVLDGMCEKAKSNMQSKASEELGTWQRAVTTSDGCW